jgi:hypothetical protein
VCVRACVRARGSKISKMRRPRPNLGRCATEKKVPRSYLNRQIAQFHDQNLCNISISSQLLYRPSTGPHTKAESLLQTRCCDQTHSVSAPSDICRKKCCAVVPQYLATGRAIQGSNGDPRAHPRSSRAVKQPGRKFDQSPPSSANVKNDWRYSSTPHVRLHGADRDSFTIFSFQS